MMQCHSAPPPPTHPVLRRGGEKCVCRTCTCVNRGWNVESGVTGWGSGTVCPVMQARSMQVARSKGCPSTPFWGPAPSGSEAGFSSPPSPTHAPPPPLMLSPSTYSLAFGFRVHVCALRFSPLTFRIHLLACLGGGRGGREEAFPSCDDACVCACAHVRLSSAHITLQCTCWRLELLPPPPHARTRTRFGIVSFACSFHWFPPIYMRVSVSSCCGCSLSVMLPWPLLMTGEGGCGTHLRASRHRLP